MKIKYNINLGNYVTKDNFDSFYNREIILNDKFKVISDKVKLEGYFPYKLFDDEDEKKVKKQYKEKLKGTMNELILKIDKNVTNSIEILIENKNIESINLYPYREGEFTIYTYITNFK